MASKATSISPSKLPPSERAAWFDSLQSYLQVCQWKLLLECNIDATNWEWKIINGKLSPIMTDKVCIYCFKT